MSITHHSIFLALSPNHPLDSKGISYKTNHLRDMDTSTGSFEYGLSDDGKASDKPVLIRSTSEISDYHTASLGLSNYREDMPDMTVEDGEIESTGRYRSASAKFSNKDLGNNKGSVSGGTSSSTVIDFLEGCLETQEDVHEHSQAFGHGDTSSLKLIHDRPTQNSSVHDHNDEITSDHVVVCGVTAHQQKFPQQPTSTSILTFPTSSQSECDFVARMLSPTTSEGDILRRKAMTHAAWSQPVGSPYVRSPHASHIDRLFNTQLDTQDLIPTRPASPIGGFSTSVITDLSAHNVAAALRLRRASSASLYSLFGPSPLSSQTSAQ